MRALFLRCSIAALTLTTSSFAQSVLDVHSIDGPYFQIQEAVDAAVSGDVIRVADAGLTYDRVLISQKSLTITGLLGELPRLPSLEIRSLAASQSVTIAGLMVAVALGDIGQAIVVSSCDGAVRFVDCVADSAGFSPVFVQCSSDLTLQGVTISGRTFQGYSTGGINLGNSTATLWNCSVSGSDSSRGTNAGAPGVYAVDSQVYLHGCTVSGGQGSPASIDNGVCLDAGRGGDAVWLLGNGRVRLLDTTLIPGLGGDGNSCAVPGDNGLEFNGTNPIQHYDGTALRLDFSTLSYESSTLNIIALGPLDGSMLLALGTQTSRVGLPGFVGDLHVGGPNGGPRRILMGQGPWVTTQLPLPALADFEVAQFYLQSVHLHAGQVTFGPVRPLTVLDSAW